MGENSEGGRSEPMFVAATIVKVDSRHVETTDIFVEGVHWGENVSVEVDDGGIPAVKDVVLISSKVLACGLTKFGDRALLEVDSEHYRLAYAVIN